ncbi:MAG: YbjN domain-containing protein [Actinobacteria bacterium]|nr:YbjN domain-containing protein [Actinomycetota bacterium]
MTSDRVLAVREKVQRYLTDAFGSVEIDKDGDFTFRRGSARVFIRVSELGPDKTVVAMWAPTNNDVPASPELFHYVATNNAYTFGSLVAFEKDAGVNIAFKHSLLGDTLDPDELVIAAILLSGTADEIDTEVRQRFGGRTFYED